MHRECRERFPRHRGLAIPTCIMARVWRTCRDACRDRLLAVSFEVGGGEKVPGSTNAYSLALEMLKNEARLKYNKNN